MWKNIVRGWSHKYFVLHENVLIFCKDKAKAIKGSIDLHEAKINLSEKDMLVITIQIKQNVFFLKAESVTEKMKWFNALIKQQEFYQ